MRSIVGVAGQNIPELYNKCTMNEKGETVLYAEPLKAPCGGPMSALLFYRKPLKDSKAI